MGEVVHEKSMHTRCLKKCLNEKLSFQVCINDSILGIRCCYNFCMLNFGSGGLIWGIYEWTLGVIVLEKPMHTRCLMKCPNEVQVWGFYIVWYYGRITVIICFSCCVQIWPKFWSFYLCLKALLQWILIFLR